MNPPQALRLGSALLLALALGSSAHAQTTCQAQWIPTFGQSPGSAGPVLDVCEFDDGSGPALFVAGSFRSAGGVETNYVAKWDGAHWSRPGAGIDAADPSYSTYARALCVYDDGTGPALYAAGTFLGASGLALHSIGRFDGTQWSALGSGLTRGPWAADVYSLAVYDDGSGPALVASGWFDTAGGVPASGIAKWDGSAWSALGSGLGTSANPGGAYALAAFDDGSGPALFAGGWFSIAGGLPASGIARFDGSIWSSVSGGVGGGAHSVHALQVFDDGSGPALYAGGEFTSAGGVSANHVARWNGSAWSALGSGMNSAVLALTVHDDGGGAALFAGGTFAVAGGTSANRVARWNGASWSAVGNLHGGEVGALGVFDDGSGPVLCAGGAFQSDATSGAQLPFVALRIGGAWTAPGSGIAGSVSALLEYDDGSGPALYANGSVAGAGGVASGVVRWNGSQWSPLGGGFTWGTYEGNVHALCVFDDGSGPALYAGGWFTNAGGVPANGIARWNGTSWSALGNGVNGTVYTLAVFDDGSGPWLYVGGSFYSAGQLQVSYFARWNGIGWAPVGSGLAGDVYATLVWDDGTGPALYAGGSFWGPLGGATTHGIARWNGASWSGLGGGLTGTSSPKVRALAAFDDGGGPALYVGGEFTSAGTSWAFDTAKWNGLAWSGLGSGVDYPAGNGGVYALVPFDDGGGAALFASGIFSVAGGQPAGGIARWRAGAWSAVGSGFNGFGSELAVFDDGSGAALYAGGSFGSCLDSLDSRLARWGQPPGCVQPGAIVCEPGVGGVGGCPCSNPPAGPGRGCENSAATGGAVLAASGTAALSGDTLVFHTRGEPPTATSLVLQGSALLPAGASFGQGLRCVAGTLKRLYVKTASAGSISAPGAGDASVHARSAALGDALLQGTRRIYGVFYRDPTVLGSCPATSTFNITQQLDVLWYP